MDLLWRKNYPWLSGFSHTIVGFDGEVNAITIDYISVSGTNITLFKYENNAKSLHKCYLISFKSLFTFEFITKDSKCRQHRASVMSSSVLLCPVSSAMLTPLFFDFHLVRVRARSWTRDFVELICFDTLHCIHSDTHFGSNDSNFSEFKKSKIKRKMHIHLFDKHTMERPHPHFDSLQPPISWIAVPHRFQRYTFMGLPTIIIWLVEKSKVR